MAGVNMRLKAGGVRELHWHKQAERSFMLAGNARITAVDNDGLNFIADVGPGDLWYFPAGIPHSIQGLSSEGCEFLLAFPDGQFSEDITFAITDLVAHTPRDILARNLSTTMEALQNIPKEELFIFQSDPPPPLREPMSMSHFIENTGDEPLRFLELFKAPRFVDVSLAQWIALTPHELVQEHLKIDRNILDGLR